MNIETYKMTSYCLQCRKDIENINSKVSKTSNGRTMLLSSSAICGSKKSRVINSSIRTPLSEVPILSDILNCY